ncbi:MAG: dephospho-CoA kinase [Bacteroidales bacterium]|nr:dephospho-CoA kinase [Bacteroidales bacterium]
MAQKVLLCTGGIGSGKSFVIRAFNALGVPSYDCDGAAKELYDRDPALLADVVRLCGDGVLDAEGRLDRAALAARIFADPALRAGIEALVHPAVIRDFRRWAAAQPGDPQLVIIESAILLEKPLAEKVYDYVLAVTAPDDVRLARVQQRSGLDTAAAQLRMAAQWSDAERAARADFVLENDGRKPVLPVILDILERIQEDGKN